MPGLASKITVSVLIVLFAVGYQAGLHRIAYVAFGNRWAVEPLSAFPYKCRRIRHERLMSCEDMWLSETTRQLFLACSEPLSREHWAPPGGNINLSGRNLDDGITVIDVDAPGVDGMFEPRALEMPDFFGNNGDGRLNLVGFGGADDEEGSGGIRLWLVNFRPSIDPVTGAFLDQYKDGANATIELFRTGAHAQKLEHVKTFFHPQIATPNRVAPVAVGNGNAFYFTNDHGVDKIGLRNQLSFYIGGGDVSFCDDVTCRKVASGMRFPNGLAKGGDGLIYVPISMTGDVDVYQPQPNGDLTKIDCIKLGYGVDNLSFDANGDMFAAVFPDPLGFFKSAKDPYNPNIKPASAALRVSKTSSGYKVSKAIEDGLGEVLPGSTTVVHDSKTGRLFMSGIFSPFIAVCEPNDTTG